ncbi:Serine protease trypsin-like protein [Phytophthora palmivora]|uniref:Serine protease trypsin-like protein n=1 Tax=Phytophthora palmivora TaxID=4796 RepID=A0A2P4XET7_9STRA|nr:Serine protease trypsin-like protein [Phytophthora palmivora]
MDQGVPDSMLRSSLEPSRMSLGCANRYSESICSTSLTTPPISHEITLRCLQLPLVSIGDCNPNTHNHPNFSERVSNLITLIVDMERPSSYQSVKLAADAADSDFKAGKMATVIGWELMRRKVGISRMS